MSNVIAWISAHAALMALVWPILTAILTAVLSELAKQPTKLGAFVRLLGSMGIDGPKLVQSLRELLGGSAGPKPPSTKLPPLIAALALTFAFLPGCAWFNSHEVQATTVAIDLAECVDHHLDDPIATIALECGMQVTPELVSLVESRRAARASMMADARLEATERASCGK